MRKFLMLLFSALCITCCGEGGDDCTQEASTVCNEGATYWVDSCGNIGLKKEDCEAGCLPDHSGCVVYECTANSNCDPGYYCDLVNHVCTEEACTPQCVDKCCGPDDCGGECPTSCPTGTQCNAITCLCEGTCQPDCDGKECGLDGCGDTCPPGCGAGETCNEANWQCEATCQPDCIGKECGPDGCGNTCSPGCGAGENCNEEVGLCEQCLPDCNGKECGPDGCGETCPPGCGTTEYCDSGTCAAITADLIWIQIKEGTFMMGSNSGDDDEQPVHEVTVPGFEMTLNEVTVAQYAVCLGDGACTAPATTEDCNWDVTGRDDHPVNCLTWQQAADFCAWATGRLPSEAEWEYAARSEGRNIAYPWGNQNPNCDYAIIGNGCGEMGTWPVCSKNAGNTEQGLCDMVGNAQEWCQDCYHETYDNAPVDGSAWEDPDCTRRVIRGGSWYSFSLDSLLTTNRFRSFASSVNAYNGFRCTRASKESLKNYFPGR